MAHTVQMSSMRVVLAGVSDRLASALRSPGRELDRTGSATEAMEMVRRSPTPRLLVVSEMLPGAGDVLAAVEADCRLSALVLVVLVGDRTALGVALRRRGMAVLAIRGAGPRLRKLARDPAVPVRQARERLLCLARDLAAASRRHVIQSRGLIDRSRQMFVPSRRGCELPPGGVHSTQGK